MILKEWAMCLFCPVMWKRWVFYRFRFRFQYFFTASASASASIHFIFTASASIKNSRFRRFRFQLQLPKFRGMGITTWWMSVDRLRMSAALLFWNWMGRASCVAFSCRRRYRAGTESFQVEKSVSIPWRIHGQIPRPRLGPLEGYKGQSRNDKSIDIVDNKKAKWISNRLTSF